MFQKKSYFGNKLQFFVSDFSLLSCSITAFVSGFGPHMLMV